MWVLRPDAPASAPWFDAVGQELRPHLIEAPIVIAAPTPASVARPPAAASA
jgi:hypothetical protein